jgi:ABC-type nitrate/sulfonate/bicarbonate transport system permease component
MMTRSAFSRADALRSFLIEGPLATVLAVGALVIVWEIGATLIDQPWLPKFSAALARAIELFASGEIQPILATSVSNLVIGYTLSVAIGLALGAGMAMSSKVQYAFRAYVDALLFIPPVLYAPLVLAFLGFSDVALIGVIVMFSAFVITASVQTAVTAVDHELQEMAGAFGAGRIQMMREVILPGAMPQIFAGLRLGMGRAVKGMVIGELFVTVVGLGALERRFASAFDAVGVWAITMIVISLAILLIWLVQAVDRAVNWWAA